MTPRRIAIAIVLGGIVASAACSRDLEVSKREHLARGEEYASRRQYEAAIIEYRNALQQDPKFGRAHARLAEAYIQTGDGANALRESVRAADLLAFDVDVQLQASNLLILAGRFGDARDRVQRVLEREPRNVRALVALGNALAGLKDVEGGVSKLEEAIQLDPQRAGSYTNLGVLHAAAGRPEQAEAAYRRAIAADPKSAPPRIALTQLYWFTARPALAEETLLGALAVAPRDAVANRLAAALYQASGQAAKAEQYLRAAVNIEGTPAAYLMLADYYLAVSRPADAAAVLRKLTTEKSVGHRAAIRLAVIDYAEGRADRARAAIDAILKSNPREVEALLVKASLLVDRRRHAEALAVVDTAIAVDPSFAPAHFARGRVLVATHRPDEAKEAFNESLRFNPRAAGAQVELAKLHLTSGAPDSAVTLAGAATKLDPRRLDARLVLARALMARRDLSQAQSILDKLRVSAPKSSAVLAQLGLLHTLKGERNAASQAFEQALALEPLELDAVNGLTALDIAAKRPAAARKRIQDLVARVPDNVDVLILAGRVYLSIGDTAQGERVLRRALTLDPGALSAYSILGALFVQQRRLPEARREFELLAERQTQPVSALTMVGLIHQMENRTAEARAAFERVIELDSRAPVAANNLAWIYAEHGGNLDIALQLAQAAKAGLPKSPEVDDTLGWVYLKKGILPLAVTAFEKAVQSAPSNPTFRYHLGLAHAQSGNAVRARSELQMALKLEPTFKDAEDAARVLTSL